MPLVEHRYPLFMVGGRGDSDMREGRKAEVIIADVFVCTYACIYRFLISSTNLKKLIIVSFNLQNGKRDKGCAYLSNSFLFG